MRYWPTFIQFCLATFIFALPVYRILDIGLRFWLIAFYANRRSLVRRFWFLVLLLSSANGPLTATYPISLLNRRY